MTGLILVALILVFTNEYYQQRLGVSPMPTMRRVRKEMVDLIPPGEGDIFELGSGWGGLARLAAKKFPQRRVIGIEGSFFPYHISRLLPKPANLSFVRGDFFEMPLSGTLLCYLSNAHMARLEKKLPPDVTLISSTFPLPNRTPTQTRVLRGLWQTTIYVYA